MYRKTKIILFTLILAISFPVSSFAVVGNNIADGDIDEFKNLKDVSFSEVKDMQPISDEEKAAMYENIVQKSLEHIKKNEPTIKERIAVLKIADPNLSYEELQKIEKVFINEEQNLKGISHSGEITLPMGESVSILATYDENKAKLRTGNVIEQTLNSDEGFTASQLASAVTCATDAKAAANILYPSNPDLNDAYRHYYWNYSMKTVMSKTKARTAGNNHEWGLVILTPVLNTYDQLYYDYINQGYSSNTAAGYAFSGTLIEIPEMKYYTYLVCDSSYSSFLGFFDDDNIMDLTNNCYGRAVTASVASAFINDLNAGNVIGDSNVVTSAQRYAVWANDWYGY